VPPYALRCADYVGLKASIRRANSAEGGDCPLYSPNLKKGFFIDILKKLNILGRKKKAVSAVMQEF
jgi:hypothetical protein